MAVLSDIGLSEPLTVLRSALGPDSPLGGSPFFMAAATPRMS